MSINRVEISGNLTRDCELKEFNNGTRILEFGVAVNDRVKRGDDWEDYANYIDCTVFVKSDRHERYLTDTLSKGAKVFIAGKLRYSSWEKDGKKRSKVGVTVDEIEVVPARESDESVSESCPSIPANTRKDPPRQAQAPAADTYDEDIPF